MNLYVATTFTNGFNKGQTTYEQLTDSEKQICDNLPHKLDSYHYVHGDKKTQEMRTAGADIFLDSGAFSAFTLNKPINIDNYAKYVIENEDIIRREDGILMASVLDAIGDAQGTLNNQAYLEKKGAMTLPCYHYGEPVAYLEYYLARYEYITIGGLVGRSANDLKAWLDPLFNNYLTDGSGNVRVKLHAFGITAIEIMNRYPWHSVDSSSAVQFALFGGAYTIPWSVLPISDQKGSTKESGKHFDTYTPMEREVIKEYIEQSGVLTDDMRTTYNSRAVFNFWEYARQGALVHSSGSNNNYMTAQSLF